MKWQVTIAGKKFLVRDMYEAIALSDMARRANLTVTDVHRVR